MKQRYTKAQLSHIIDQSLVYQCACPAQVAKEIVAVRELYEYQEKCLDSTKIDKKVHQSIYETAIECHEKLENCLSTILTIEGWDPYSLDMPDKIKDKFELF